jgi:hypothetical protein
MESPQKRRRRQYSAADVRERIRGLADAARKIAKEELAAKTEDIVMTKLLELGSPLTQQNYLQLAYWDNRKLEDLGPEERAELPEGFEEWPRTEKDIN